MFLTELIETYSAEGGAPNPEIRGITDDSRAVRAGYLFCALKGERMDGSAFIGAALRHGAVAVLTDDDVVLTEDMDGAEGVDFSQIAHEGAANPRHVMALAAAKFYGKQSEHIVAVTGTNGKTSTAYFVQQLWAALGHKAASLGTLGVRGAGMDRAGALTTPDSVALHAQLADLAAGKVTHVAMEASSHGLAQHRLDGVKISAAGFTNLTRDHLDYHRTMEAYLAAKLRLFTELLPEKAPAVLNADIEQFGAMKVAIENAGRRVLSYGLQGADICLESVTPTHKGQKIAVTLKVTGQTHHLTLPFVGAFQVMNALCALGLVLADVEDSAAASVAEKAMAALENLTGAPGRLQLVGGHPKGAVYVDYAHTPDALDNVLQAVRPHTAGKLYCIIGCGGDRDPGKRPLMGQIADHLADVAIITDDNPRGEDPAKIRKQMMDATKNAREIGDRKEAIGFAIGALAEGDILVIAGKGHEQGQIVGGVVHPFDDVAVAREFIGKL